MIALFVLAVLLLSCAGYVVHAARDLRHATARSWSDVLAKLQSVDVDGLEAIANSCLHSADSQADAVANWELAGGLQGVRRLRANARIMLDLALFVEQLDIVAERWNRDGEHSVSTMIRFEAVRLNKAVKRIQLVYIFRFGFVGTSSQLRDAAESYCLIRNRLLTFYQTSHAKLLPRLHAAL